MSGRKYDMLQNGNGSRENDMRTLVFRNKVRYENGKWKTPPSYNAARRWLKQFQETGRVLHRQGARRLSTSQEDVDRIQEAFSRSPQAFCSFDSTGNKTFLSYTFIFRKHFFFPV
jgi:hypothetical protein